MLHRIMMKLGH